MRWFDSPYKKIYILDPITNVFYELDDLGFVFNLEDMKSINLMITSHTFIYHWAIYFLTVAYYFSALIFGYLTDAESCEQSKDVEWC